MKTVTNIATDAEFQLEGSNLLYGYWNIPYRVAIDSSRYFPASKIMSFIVGKIILFETPSKYATIKVTLLQKFKVFALQQ